MWPVKKTNKQTNKQKLIRFGLSVKVDAHKATGYMVRYLLFIAKSLFLGGQRAEVILA